MADFNKIFTFDGLFEKTNEPRCQIIRPGFPEERVKVASEATDYIKHVTPKEGKTIILVLAMSDGLLYGPNRNGDSFAGKPVPGRVLAGGTLPEHYKKFVTNAKVYMHHQNRDPKKSVGDVAAAFYNFKMGRVELLLEVDNIKAADTVASIDRGEYPAVSMGTKIAYDVCDLCGNKAKTRADYCDHLKYQMMEILPSGQRVFCWNPSPNLFDISFVRRPADKIAYTMLKAATDLAISELPIVTSAELGEKVAALDMKMAAAKKLADMVKQVKGEPIETSNMPKAEEIVNRGFIQHSLPDILNKRPEFDNKTLDDASEFSTEEILSTMSRMGLDPTAGEMTSIVAKKLNPGTQVPSEVKTAADIVSFALIKLAAEDPVLTAALDQLPWTKLSDEHFNQDLANKLEPWLEKRSNLKRYLYMNALPEPMRPNEPGRWDPVETTDPQTGQQYKTNRGAADMANNSNVRRQLGTAAGIGGLSALGYGITRALGHPTAALAFPALGALGAHAAWNVQSVPGYQPETGGGSGLTVPMNSEMRKMSSVAPVAGIATAALLTLLGQQHANATNFGDLDTPERKRSIAELAFAHPALAFISGLLLLAAGHAALTGAPAIPETLIKAGSYDSVEVPELDIMKFAEFIGDGIISLALVLRNS